MTTVAHRTAREAGPVRTPRLRADASRNRERILLAARDALVEHGADAPLDEIAKRAGVGNATLYRNFPTRVALIREVALHVKNRVVAIAERAATEVVGPFDALERFAHETVDEKLGALCPMLTDRIDLHDPDLVEARERLLGVVGGLLDRAKAAGELRPDVDHGDLFIAISQLTRPLPGTSCHVMGDFVHRHLQLFLDGMRAPARSLLPGRPATFEDFHSDH
ncbi:TetR/AcrR family transcriptional regulator [Kitasatospora sp. NPDC056327]|uniref:TetR/AcrR family transcriptional regulator n=1 Tax=Kitasatospora sp. NPDC056327 TaxID=3345785 RepID=UPI0035D94114